MKILWESPEHKEFFVNSIARAKRDDVYHQALFYTLGLHPDTRNHINYLYDFKLHQINFNEINEGWPTSGTYKLCLLAFNLFNGFVKEDKEYLSSPYELFCVGFAPYMVCAIQLRYLEYFKM